MKKKKREKKKKNKTKPSKEGVVDLKVCVTPLRDPRETISATAKWVGLQVQSLYWHGNR